MQKFTLRLGKHWKYRFITFAIIAIASLIVQITLCEDAVFSFGDSRDYWERGVSLWKDGKFSLTNQMDGFRGYVFPLFLGICNQVGGVACFRIVNALMVAFLFSVLLPEVFELDQYTGKQAGAVLILYGLFTLFYYGLYVYALSDLFAFFLCIAATCLVKRLTVTDSKAQIAVFSTLIGLLAYAMYNVRTIYMFASACIVLYVLFTFVRKRSITEKIICFFTQILGFGIAGLPQALMNWGYLKEVSLSVPTQGLMLKQLVWGLLYQRYDTYYGTQQGMPQMYFVDAVGENILKAEGIMETGLKTMGEYIKLCLKYPFEVVGIYTRHVLNMLFPAWPNQYVLDLDSSKIIVMLIAFHCLFLISVSYILGRVKNKNLKNFFPVLLPVAAIMPGAVESRFFMPLYVVILGKICFDIDWAALFGDIKKYWYKVAIGYGITFCIIVSVWSSMLASENAYPIFF